MNSYVLHEISLQWICLSAERRGGYRGVRVVIMSYSVLFISRTYWPAVGWTQNNETNADPDPALKVNADPHLRQVLNFITSTVHNFFNCHDVFRHSYFLASALYVHYKLSTFCMVFV